MRHKTLVFFIIFSTSLPAMESKKLSFLPFKKNILENIAEGEIYSASEVNSKKENKTQTFDFKIAGLHPKSCNYALKTLSIYEEYNLYLSFIRNSKYHEASKEITLDLVHFLLPFDLTLKFKLPRMRSPGSYHFTFEEGPLKNLLGQIQITAIDNQCLFLVTANWSGNDTGINDSVLQIFTQILSKMTMEKLFTVSKTLAH